jgi:hypothetical protein
LDVVGRIRASRVAQCASCKSRDQITFRT